MSSISPLRRIVLSRKKRSQSDSPLCNGHVKECFYHDAAAKWAGLQAVKMTISAELSDCILPADVGVFY